MLNNEGNGGIEKVELVMAQWKLATIEPFTSREKAQRFIDIYSKITYGKAGSQMLEVEWQITEVDSKFYVWYKPLKKHAL